MFAMIYPDGHPYGRPAKGRVETVSRLDRATLQRFHRSRFAPSGLTVIVVGDVDHSRAADLSERVFGEWKAAMPAEITLPHPPLLPERRERVIPMMNKAQADIAYGFTTIVRSDPSYYAYTLMNNALGQYGIGGRLGDNIRESQGMAYYVYSSFDANVVEGPLFVRAGVNPNNVERAIAAIDNELRKMAGEGMTAEEGFPQEIRQGQGEQDGHGVSHAGHLREYNSRWHGRLAHDSPRERLPNSNHGRDARATSYYEASGKASVVWRRSASSSASVTSKAGWASGAEASSERWREAWA